MFAKSSATPPWPLRGRPSIVSMTTVRGRLDKQEIDNFVSNAATDNVQGVTGRARSRGVAGRWREEGSGQVWLEISLNYLKSRR